MCACVCVCVCVCVGEGPEGAQMPCKGLSAQQCPIRGEFRADGKPPSSDVIGLILPPLSPIRPRGGPSISEMQFTCLACDADIVDAVFLILQTPSSPPAQAFTNKGIDKMGQNTAIRSLECIRIDSTPFH